MTFGSTIAADRPLLPLADVIAAIKAAAIGGTREAVPLARADLLARTARCPDGTLCAAPTVCDAGGECHYTGTDIFASPDTRVWIPPTIRAVSIPSADVTAPGCAPCHGVVRKVSSWAVKPIGYGTNIAGARSIIESLGVRVGGYDHATGWFTGCAIYGDLKALRDQHFAVCSEPVGRRAADLAIRAVGFCPDGTACQGRARCEADDECHYTGTPLSVVDTARRILDELSAFPVLPIPEPTVFSGIGVVVERPKLAAGEDTSHRPCERRALLGRRRLPCGQRADKSGDNLFSRLVDRRSVDVGADVRDTVLRDQARQSDRRVASGPRRQYQHQYWMWIGREATPVRLLASPVDRRVAASIDAPAHLTIDDPSCSHGIAERRSCETEGRRIRSAPPATRADGTGDAGGTRGSQRRKS